VTVYSLVGRYHRFGGTLFLHLQGRDWYGNVWWVEGSGQGQ